MKSIDMKLWISVTAVIFTTACSKVSFSPGDASLANSSQGVGGSPGSGGVGGGGLPGSTCNGNLGTTTELTKMLFIVDTSGSNQQAPACPIGPNCTDPGKKMRDGSIQRFLNDYGAKSNFAWSFETFQGTTCTPLITNTSGSAVFSTAGTMQTALNTFMTMVDTDNTPYMAALNTATMDIANDPDLHSTSHPQYIVVFMSDGQPDGAGDTPDAITAQVKTLVNLLPGKITFNTVYYGNGDAMAAGILQGMAQNGNGNFLNTSLNPTGLDFKISDLVNVPCP